MIGKWPWMVLLGRWTDAGLGSWFCGGALITDRHVLTAAHCLRPEEAGTVGALIGDNDLNRQDEVDHQQRNVSGIVRHPHYLGSQNDLAVVRLAAPVRLTQDVSPICLPPAGAEHRRQDVEMAGWGLLEFAGEPSDILQEVALRVADLAACEAAYRRVPQFEARFPGRLPGHQGVCREPGWRAAGRVSRRLGRSSDGPTGEQHLPAGGRGVCRSGLRQSRVSRPLHQGVGLHRLDRQPAHLVAQLTVHAPRPIEVSYLGCKMVFI